MILTVTRLRVLFRPKRMGYRSDKYRSMDIEHKCIMLAVQNSTSKHIHTKQCTDSNGKYPEMTQENTANYLLLVNNANAASLKRIVVNGDFKSF